MREAKSAEDVVGARLRVVLAETTHEAAGDRPATIGHFSDTSPLKWTDIVPSWPEDLDLDPEAPEPSAPAEPLVSAGRAGSDVTGIRAEPLPPPRRDSSENPDADQGSALTSAGAFSAAPGRLLAFDPGRRGVKALAAVAVAVVFVAAFLAWRARPRVDPVAAPPLEVASTDQSNAATAMPGPSGGADVVVAVGGKVHKPGLVHLPPGARVADALQAAGGADPGTDVALLNLARKVVDGELILVGVTPPPGAVVGAPAAAGGPPGGQINLNTATLADLDKLPGVGPVLAQRILDARDAQGGFKAVGDLRKVDGIGDARYDQLKDLVVV